MSSSPADRSRPDPSRLRVGDAEREQAAAVLAEHYEHGRVTPVEYSERLDAVWSARTRADLDVLFHDLPRVGAGRESASAPRESAGPRWWVLVLAALGVLFVLTRIPWLLIVAAVVGFVALKHHRRRQRTGTGGAYWH